MSYPALNVPLPESTVDLSSSLDPPRAPYATSGTPVDGSDATASAHNSSSHLPVNKNEQDDGLAASPADSKPNKKLRWLIAAAALVVVVLAVVIPVYFTVIKPKNNKTSGATGNNSGSSDGSSSGGDSKPESPKSNISGGDGSSITTEDGSTFTYSNKFGGYWVSDPEDPFNNGARPNSWTPPLNASWTWGKDHIYGVNLGGLFVLEPFISPALFQKYPSAIDEWTLSEAMADDKANGGLDQLEEHYKTFIVEQDIAEIAGAGLNWVRLPIPFWAISTMKGEPFLERVSWKYILRVVGWCRKYGLRVKLDLHTIPGSANAYNHGGKAGALNFLAGPMGIANAQRAAEYIRILTEFFSQPEYKDVVLVFGIMNEPLQHSLGKENLLSFYIEMHKNLRAITGFGTGNGPFFSIHDGFDGPANWAGDLKGADRVALDYHPYFAFNGQANDGPIATGTGNSAGGEWPEKACTSWGNTMRRSQKGFGVTFAGEFSNGYNDCGLYVRGVRGSPTTPNCDFFTDSSQWDAATKAGLLAFASASMDALGDWFFWTWKIGNSTKGIVEAPLWSYKLGLENGWMPKDPRDVVGKCEKVGVNLNTFDGEYDSWQTGGAGAGTIAPSSTSAYPWPPSAIISVNAPVSLLPTYTQTGPIVTLPPPTFSPTATHSIDGWANDNDKVGAWVPVAGCTYPDSWDPSPNVPDLCTGNGAGPSETAAEPTPEPTAEPTARRRQIRQMQH